MDIQASASNEIYHLRRAFPSSLADQVQVMRSKIHLGATYPVGYAGFFSVIVEGEALEIPYRVYYPEQISYGSRPLIAVHEELLSCLFSRHHDGYVRERGLKNVIGSSNSWVVPYVIRLVGEYVIEILDVIYQHLPLLNREIYRDFLLNNSQFYTLTKCRVISYWDCFYRAQYPKRENYVGFQIIKFFDALLE